MPQELLDGVGTRKLRPNPVLYVSTSGDMTSDLWRARLGRDPVIIHISLMACLIDGLIPRPDPANVSSVRQRLLAVENSSEFLTLKRLFHQLPPALRPARTMINEEYLSFAMRVSRSCCRFVN